MECSLSSGNAKILYRAIQALSKLGSEDLYFEARANGLSLKAVSKSGSAFAYFTFSPLFFVSFTLGQTSNAPSTNALLASDRTSPNYCKIGMRSALLTLKSLASVDSVRIEIDTDDCYVQFACLFRQGILRTYQLPLLQCEIMQPLFDKSTCQNRLVSPCKVILDAVHRSFSTSQQEVVLAVVDREMTFSSYVEDQPDPKKVPRTELRLSAEEFLEFDVAFDTEITFALTEFRALLSFVEHCPVPITFVFGEPGDPAIFSLENIGDYSAEYVLATMTNSALSSCDVRPSMKRRKIAKSSTATFPVRMNESSLENITTTTCNIGECDNVADERCTMVEREATFRFWDIWSQKSAALLSSSNSREEMLASDSDFDD
ncbi:Cell cycle checkpoint control protein RAD9A [Trichuris trichiura]|uniref:Cell cycle checkpoint control protein RAD9A n=1 Tax=Trichuris trichiura TaxID=36087 RepID=A0A077Z100_TRITR|nr:Cell cycle checkpoint control protein RAD9A [Trichuris trichiura]